MYLQIRATDGVIAPGHAVQVYVNDGGWRNAMVVTPWAESSLGSVVYLELDGGGQRE